MLPPSGPYSEKIVSILFYDPMNAPLVSVLTPSHYLSVNLHHTISHLSTLTFIHHHNVEI